MSNDIEVRKLVMRITNQNPLYVDFFRERLRNALRRREENIEELTDPTNISQTRYSFLESDCELIAFDYFGLGYPLEDVRRSFAESAAASLKVMELRGTEDAFPVLLVKIDPTKSEDDPSGVTSHWRDPTRNQGLFGGQLPRLSRRNVPRVGR